MSERPIIRSHPPPTKSYKLRTFSFFESKKKVSDQPSSPPHPTISPPFLPLQKDTQNELENGGVNEKKKEKLQVFDDLINV